MKEKPKAFYVVIDILILFLLISIPLVYLLFQPYPQCTYGGTGIQLGNGPDGIYIPLNGTNLKHQGNFSNAKYSIVMTFENKSQQIVGLQPYLENYDTPKIQLNIFPGHVGAGYTYPTNKWCVFSIKFIVASWVAHIFPTTIMALLSY